MADQKKRSSLVNGLGTGYVSVIMIFVVIVLTTLAALSFSAAGSGSRFSERTKENMAAFYDAECAANKTLMQLDEAAFEAAESGLFMTFADSGAAIDGVTVNMCPEGYKAGWSEEITDKLSLLCEVTFYSEPELHGGERYTITKWAAVPGDSSAETQLHVWDGTF